MRRTITNEVVLLIAGVLLASALAFAWGRSRRAGMDVASSPGDHSAAARFNWRDLGAQTYAARCASCHGEGEATRRVPPLRGHAVDLFRAEGGRGYLVDFLLYGLKGRIEVGGVAYNGRHPVYVDRLSDDEAAAVLNHMLTAWGNAALLGDGARLLDGAEVAAHRAKPLRPSEVPPLRPALR